MAARLLALSALVLVSLALGMIVRRALPASRPAMAKPPAAARGPDQQRTRWRLPPAPADVRGARARRMPVPILMYHVITQAPAGAANARLWVRHENFAAEMRALRHAGYYAITLRQA